MFEIRYFLAHMVRRRSMKLAVRGLKIESGIKTDD